MYVLEREGDGVAKNEWEAVDFLLYTQESFTRWQDPAEASSK